MFNLYNKLRAARKHLRKLNKEPTYGISRRVAQARMELEGCVAAKRNRNLIVSHTRRDGATVNGKNEICEEIL
ncbi:hypothetical protein MLD38_031366 [Melastoma candidum]|uniref:Uncharacterized protein n=1 Tax=Melastoma candidum TaxID=119954 RepID=A0ACB9MNU2_9MYRT|nr:hypothetical protein MLD38_031366 [Melastoma candidum]